MHCSPCGKINFYRVNSSFICSFYSSHFTLRLTLSHSLFLPSFAIISDGPEYCQASDRSAVCSELCSNPGYLEILSDNTTKIGCSACLACQDSNVLSVYELHNCHKADPTAPLCGNSGIPVCGIGAQGNLVNFGNECGACSTLGFKTYFHGKCPVVRHRTNCGNSTIRFTTLCANIVVPVCAVNSTSNEETYNNGCLACHNREVDYYWSGSC